jgi:hypothetical protein
MRNNLKVWIRALAIAVVAVPVLSLASDLTTPNTFASGTLIQSAQVNANFAAIQTAVNSKQDAIQATACGTGQAVTGVAAVGGALTCGPAGLAFGASVSGSSGANTAGVTVINGGAGVGIEGQTTSSANQAFGVVGDATAAATGAEAAGVRGQSEGGQIGVWGSTVGTGILSGSIGVYGTLTGGGIAVEGDAVTSGTLAGIGVVGQTNQSDVFSTGVQAYNSNATGNALSITQGYFQVTGAGANTSTTAFIWTTAAPNITANQTFINNPMTNGGANLILIVTHNEGVNSAVVDIHPFAVHYDNQGAGSWVIANVDNGTMPVGAMFNVLVIHP